MTTFPQEKIKIEKRIKTGTKLVLITEQIHWSPGIYRDLKSLSKKSSYYPSGLGHWKRDWFYSDANWFPQF